MKELERALTQAVGRMDVAWQVIGLLIESHPDGQRFAEVLAQRCDAWASRLDVPTTGAAKAYHSGYVAALAELRLLARKEP